MTHSSVRRWLEDHTLIEPTLLEGLGFESLVAERVATFGGSEPAYIAELASSPDELDRLIAGIAVPETWLFRYPRSYDLLLDFLRRRLAAGRVAWRIRNLFNLPEVISLVRGLNGAEPYWMRVIEYAVDGCLQAVLDEYAHRH